MHLLLPLLLGVGIAVAWPKALGVVDLSRREIWGIDRQLVSTAISGPVATNVYPTEVIVETRNRRLDGLIHYHIDHRLQADIQAELDKYRPDHAVVVAVDPASGHILAMANVQREGRLTENLALRATFPSASVFKIVTAAAAIDMGKADAETIIPYNGKTTSLYKRNVFDHRTNKWTRRDPLRESFGKSANTAFGRLGLYQVGGEALYDYAVRFGFNRMLGTDIQLQSSATRIDLEDDWSIVEAASGYTRNNTMSPLHGALLGATIVNDGVMVEPTLVDAITDANGILLYEAPDPASRRVISVEAAREMRLLMRETVRNGSADGAFKGFFRGPFANVEVGGKTGSLTGFEPRGRYEWFVGYAERGERRLAVAALCINKEYWYVKSAHLARKAIESYFGGDR